MIKIKKRKIAEIGALICAIIIGILFVFCITAEAKSHHRNGKVTNAAGDTFFYKNGKLQTGYFTYHGKKYYAHKTKSRLYPKGAVAKNTYRVKNGRLYYYGPDGARQVKNSRYITLNKASKSVHYIYAPGMIRRSRYNANHKRFQWLDDDGHWKDTGSRGWPEGMIDWQE